MSASRGSSVRWAVEWYVSKTLIGDGRPFNGVTFIDAPSAGAAWEQYVTRPTDPDVPGGRHGGAQVLRVAEADDLPDLPPLREIIDALGVA